MILRIITCLCSFLALLQAATPPATAAGPAQKAEARLRRLQNNAPALYAFLLRMPKGADLHTHLSGAVYAESYLREAARAGLCIDLHNLSYTEPGRSGQCKPEEANAAATEVNTTLAARMIDSLSMRAFVPGQESGHDHFFATFDKFGPVSHNHEGEAIAEVVERAAQQNESYLELMALTSGGAVMKLGEQAGFEGDYDTSRQKLMRLGLEKEVAALREKVEALDQQRIRLLHCDTDPHSAPCSVTVRYILQVLRNTPKESVFAQVLAGFMLAASEPRVVSVNLVQPEDFLISMRDYHLHMQMVDYAKRLYPQVHITLHAGELAPGLVTPEGLRSHVREAVLVGHAERIGHGVDIGYETDSADTLRVMRERHVDVEINLSSNDEILGIRGADHPFVLYRQAGVPVTLSTDDEGVGRTHLTMEYQRAVQSYALTYSDLKGIVRNSLALSFLPGAGLWSDHTYNHLAPACAPGLETKSCKAFLKVNEKALAQKDLEDRFLSFEKSIQ